MQDGIEYSSLANGLEYSEGRYYWREASSISFQSVVEHLHQVHNVQLLDQWPKKLPPLPRRRKQSIHIAPPVVMMRQKNIFSSETATLAAPAAPSRPYQQPLKDEETSLINQLVFGLHPLITEIAALRQDIRDLHSSHALYRPLAPSMAVASTLYAPVRSDSSA